MSTLTRDPTINMHLVVESDPAKVSVSGVCATTLTLNGGRHYLFKGTWSGTLTASNGSFAYDLVYDCVKSKA